MQCVAWLYSPDALKKWTPTRSRSRCIISSAQRGQQKSGWSGLRESNPSSWLGKPEHYHYAKPACGGKIASARRRSSALAADALPAFRALGCPPPSLHRLRAHQNGGDDAGLIAAHAPGMIGAALHENVARL